MQVTINNDATQWIAAQTQKQINAYNTKCQEAVNNDLGTWRNVGGGLYDYHISGDFRMVAKKSGGINVIATDTFNVLAIYRHAKKGKEWVAGQKVPAYG